MMLAVLTTGSSCEHKMRSLRDFGPTVQRASSDRVPLTKRSWQLLFAGWSEPGGWVATFRRLNGRVKG
jgi:hypothetical protein